MATVGESVLQHNVLELTEQLYTAYARIKALDHEIAELKRDLENKQKVIDGLAANLNGN